ncbi:DUF4134 family protein, partial [Butyricimonas sp.]|uniref:DUF4134 family protein n=1 Tax=Butyricimonas sp. TaxID=1969738 RepID=UPI001B139047
MFEKAKRFAKKIATSKKAQMTCLMMVCGVTAMMAQTTAGDYSAGTAALTQVSEEIAKYVPIVVKLCYAIAGVVAVVGAISVYIAMNNEEQDVKNILVLQNWLERIRKEVTNKVLSIKRISDFLIFPILAQP